MVNSKVESYKLFNPILSKNFPAFLFLLSVILKNKETHIHLVMMDDRDNPYNRKTSELNNYCETVTVVPFEAKSLIAMALSKYPASIANRLSMTFIKFVKGILNAGDIDVIVINHFKLSYIIEYLKSYKQKKIIITHDIEQELSKSVYRGMPNIIKRIVYYWDYIKVRCFLAFF